MQFCLAGAGIIYQQSNDEHVVLQIDRWNDYDFVTQFFATYISPVGEKVKLGNIKIGYHGQEESSTTFEEILRRYGETFQSLEEDFFSLGGDADFYKNCSSLDSQIKLDILNSLRDVVANQTILTSIGDEPVFHISLLRNTSYSVIQGQYTRLIRGESAHQNYNFRFVCAQRKNIERLTLEFSVDIKRRLSTNIHAIIGRNGAGKTTILNEMIGALTNKSPITPDQARFESSQSNSPYQSPNISSTDFFSGLVSVSFSAFDQFPPPPDQRGPYKGPKYRYVGLRAKENRQELRTLSQLHQECIEELGYCFDDEKRTERWLDSMQILGRSDVLFGALGLIDLPERYASTIGIEPSFFKRRQMLLSGDFNNFVQPSLDAMSSGHFIVFHTMTQLVAAVDEKTLVLIDEPEVHLHPPLLSAFIRALEELLRERNGVAIIATHSPVVLQEIPSTCVWKIYRVGSRVSVSRPARDTFGENVGVLTSEVFGLDVERSGFHTLLSEAVKKGHTYEEILESIDWQLGLEGRAVLSSLIANRDKRSKR